MVKSLWDEPLMSMKPVHAETVEKVAVEEEVAVEVAVEEEEEEVTAVDAGIKRRGV
jgi:hypothetical protein